MSTRNHSPRSRGFRPEANTLEGRQLLSAVVSGMDSKGDAWTLRLLGPGTLNVVKQPDASGNPAALDSATDIHTITIGGTNPLTSRVVGTVTPAAGSDGRVFFQRLTQIPSSSEQFSGSGLGLVSIDMPNFWLGNTTPSTSTATHEAPRIEIPDGVDTLRFGGVDTTFNQQPATSTTTSDVDTVTLGLPLFGGTRIIIDRAVSSSQSFTSSTSGTPTTTVLQHGVFFTTGGRLQLFQANGIDGDAANPPGQFLSTPSQTNTAIGGTYVVSTEAGDTPFFTTNEATGVLSFHGAVTGAIGTVRVGGNATNLTTIVRDPTQSGEAKISNFFIGGETNNVILSAPNGARDIFFGRGMDNTTILTHVINELQANRGALNSNVYSDRTISRVDFGGDVVNTNVISGVNQNFTNIFEAIAGVGTSVLSPVVPPTPPPVPSNAESFGGMTVHVAGDVTNSVFAASVEPFTPAATSTNATPTPLFGDPNQLVLSGGHITAKVEGTISNGTATPSTPNQAFFAQHVSLLSGPVVPPHVPQAPYAGNGLPANLPGILPTPLPGGGSIVAGGGNAAFTRGEAHAAATNTAVAAANATHVNTSAPAAGTPAKKGTGRPDPRRAPN
jgi:hypothetical protein